MAVTIQEVFVERAVPAIITSLAFIIAVACYQYYVNASNVVRLPRIRDEGRNRFSLRTRLAYFTDCQRLYREAYTKYSKHGKTCIVPGVGLQEEIVFPNSSLKWLVSQPSNVLSSFEAFLQIDRAEYTLGGAKYVLNPWNSLLVRKEMSKVLEILAAAVDDELGRAFKKWMSPSEEWQEVPINRTLKTIVAQASNRFTIGEPLCRDEQYLRAAIAWVDLFVPTAAIIGLMPKLIRCVVGPIVSLPMSYQAWRITKLITPLYNDRIQLIQQTDGSDQASEPQDHIQMMFRYAQKFIPSELNLYDITRRLLLSNLGSFHQTTIALTNAVYDLLASNAEFDTISVLRQEMSSVMTEMGDKTWTKTGIAKMIQTDSFLREVLRLRSFGNRSILRKVMTDDFMTEDGIHIPKGSMISVFAHPAQCDQEVFTDPLKFDPFRFSRQREAAADSEDDAAASIAFVSTSAIYLPFGHGKQACPGRFLLEFELKMIIAYLVLNYDISFPEEYGERRPETKWVAEAQMPDTSARIRMRKRRVVHDDA